MFPSRGQVDRWWKRVVKGWVFRAWKQQQIKTPLFHFFASQDLYGTTVPYCRWIWYCQPPPGARTTDCLPPHWHHTTHDLPHCPNCSSIQLMPHPYIPKQKPTRGIVNRRGTFGLPWCYLLLMPVGKFDCLILFDWFRSNNKEKIVGCSIRSLARFYVLFVPSILFTVLYCTWHGSRGSSRSHRGARQHYDM